MFGMCSRAVSKYKLAMAQGDEVARCEETAEGPDLISLSLTDFTWSCGCSRGVSGTVFIYFLVPLPPALQTNTICSGSYFYFYFF